MTLFPIVDVRLLSPFFNTCASSIYRRADSNRRIHFSIYILVSATSFCPFTVGLWELVGFFPCDTEFAWPIYAARTSDHLRAKKKNKTNSFSHSSRNWRLQCARVVLLNFSHNFFSLRIFTRCLKMVLSANLWIDILRHSIRIISSQLVHLCWHRLVIYWCIHFMAICYGLRKIFYHRQRNWLKT